MSADPNTGGKFRSRSSMKNIAIVPNATGKMAREAAQAIALSNGVPALKWLDAPRMTWVITIDSSATVPTRAALHTF